MGSSVARLASACFLVAILLLSIPGVAEATYHGGAPVPSISAASPEGFLDREGVVRIPFTVANAGSAAGTFTLRARGNDPAWTGTILGPGGSVASTVTLDPGESRAFDLEVRAPSSVPQRTVVPFDVEALTGDGSQSARVALRAAIVDRAVSLRIAAPTLDVVPGIAKEWTLVIRNEGNTNDTLNVSADLSRLPSWQATFPTTQFALAPDTSAQVRVMVRPPTDPLPPPGAVSWSFFAGSIGGKNGSAPPLVSATATATVLSYRVADVDADDRPELAVDENKDPSDGFERFFEIHSQGTRSIVASTHKLDGRTTFFLETLVGRPSDGIADVWFDPETRGVHPIRHVVPLLAVPGNVYLLDTTRDGSIDRAFHNGSAGDWRVVEIDVHRSQARQFLLGLAGHDLALYFDPAGPIVNVTTAYHFGANSSYVGIATTGQGGPDRFFDPRTGAISRLVIASPAPDEVVAGPVSITGRAAEGTTSVTVRIDDGPENVANGTSGWTFIWENGTLVDGAHTIVATAHGAAGEASNATRSFRLGGATSSPSRSPTSSPSVSLPVTVVSPGATPMDVPEGLDPSTVPGVPWLAVLGALALAGLGRRRAIVK